MVGDKATLGVDKNITYFWGLIKKRGSSRSYPSHRSVGYTIWENAISKCNIRKCNNIRYIISKYAPFSHLALHDRSCMAILPFPVNVPYVTYCYVHCYDKWRIASEGQHCQQFSSIKNQTSISKSLIFKTTLPRFIIHEQQCSNFHFLPKLKIKPRRLKKRSFNFHSLSPAW